EANFVFLDVVSEHRNGTHQGRRAERCHRESNNRNARITQLLGAESVVAKASDMRLETGSIEPPRQLCKISLASSDTELPNHQQDRNGCQSSKITSAFAFAS